MNATSWYGLQAIEEVARACKLPYLLLCSTDDPDVKATWRALGFLFTSEEVRLCPSLSLWPTSRVYCRMCAAETCDPATYVSDFRV
jgi:hypothetical protein